MTLETKKDNEQPPKLEPMSYPPKLDQEPAVDDSSTIKVHLKEEPEEEDCYHLPRLFAEASHLKFTPKTRKKKAAASSRTPRLKPKWTPY